MASDLSERLRQEWTDEMRERVPSICWKVSEHGDSCCILSADHKGCCGWIKRP